jgi:hypothetical protein
MNENEYGGVAFSDLYTPEGQKVALTARANTTKEALDMLIDAITYAATRNLYAKGHGPTGQPAPKPAPQAPALPEEPPFDWPEDAEEFPFDEGAPIETEQEPIMGKDWGLCKYPPKASELSFGDKFEVTVDNYKVSDGNIKFFSPGGQYPVVTHNLKNDYTRGQFEEIFKGWKPKEDGETHTTPEMVLTVQCTGPDKQTKAGNPYKNLAAARRA